jgi:hypothetical protein
MNIILSYFYLFLYSLIALISGFIIASSTITDDSQDTKGGFDFFIFFKKTTLKDFSIWFKDLFFSGDFMESFNHLSEKVLEITEWLLVRILWIIFYLSNFLIIKYKK